MKDLLSIKEFSRLSGIEASTLRYWDDIGLFSPAKRDPENNYRYYAPEQIVTVNFISVLSELKLPLKTIGELAKKRDPDAIIDLIERQENLLDVEMRRLQECYSIIHSRRDLIKLGKKEAGSEVFVCHKEEKALILGPRNQFTENESFYEPFLEFCQRAKQMHINLSHPIGGYHESAEAFFSAPGRPDRFFSYDPTGTEKRAAGEYLVGLTQGYYGEMDDIAKKMKVYADEHALRLSGPLYSLYLHDELCISDPSRYLSQVCVAIS